MTAISVDFEFSAGAVALVGPLHRSAAMRRSFKPLRSLHGGGVGQKRPSHCNPGRPKQVPATKACNHPRLSTQGGASRDVVCSAATYYTVMFTKRSTKKHKVYDDGILRVGDAKAALFDLTGKERGKVRYKSTAPIPNGSTLDVGGYEIEIMASLESAEFTSGRVFCGNSASNTAVVAKSTTATLARGGLKRAFVAPVGLGKTLQTLTLIWTLLKQSTRGGNVPSVSKVCVVTPSSLVSNWAKEVQKWLSDTRLRVVAVTDGGKGAAAAVREWGQTRTRPLLLISYEMYRKHADNIVRVAGYDLLVCDEGHRLKNRAGNKTIAALERSRTRRRIILTGTPLQNNLDEFFAMISFVSPGCLGDDKTFRRVFCGPIERGRDRSASAEERRIASERLTELRNMTESLVLRRLQNSILGALLPPKRTSTVFCRLSSLQVELYRTFVTSNAVQRLLRSTGSSSGKRGRSKNGSIATLALIQRLQQLCTHPILLRNIIGGSHDCDEEDAEDATADDLELPPALHARFLESIDGDEAFGATVSGKIAFVDAMLGSMRRLEPSERVVLVSCYTRTLDLLQRLCERRSWTFVRLDGSTKQSDRIRLVDRFNARVGVGGTSEPFVFLLSSKAGGTGLNLIGGNRLVLCDPDWNPAVDAQAMARVWREGQRKPVYIYRLLSTGTIEERIFQRQLMKGQLSDGLVSSANAQLEQGRSRKDTTKLSREEIKRLFDLNENTRCDTFDMLRNSASTMNDESDAEQAVKRRRVKHVVDSDDESDDAVALDDDVVTSAGRNSSGGWPVWPGVESLDDAVLRYAAESVVVGAEPVVTWVQTSLNDESGAKEETANEGERRSVEKEDNECDFGEDDDCSWLDD